MKTIAIIPARAGSKGIKDKNIIDFCGKPLIAWSIEQAKAAKCIDEVFVSTDGEKIANVSERYGAKVIWRPGELATDTATSEDAIIHAVLEVEKKMPVKTVVFLQATSPIREKNDIDNAYNVFMEKNYDSLFSMTKLDDYCLWKYSDDKLRSFTYDYKKRGRRQERDPLYLENGSIYIFYVEIVKEFHNRLGGNIGMYEMPFERSYEIDSKNEIAICEYFMRRLESGKEEI